MVAGGDVPVPGDDPDVVEVDVCADAGRPSLPEELLVLADACVGTRAVPSVNCEELARLICLGTKFAPGVAAAAVVGATGFDTPATLSLL